MHLTTTQTLLLIAALALGTMLTRFLPFLLFPENKKPPAYIVYLGQVLPYAAIGLLVIYCLKGISLTQSPFGLPEAIAIASIILLYNWKKSTLLSIGAGTVIYMFLVQFVFV